MVLCSPVKTASRCRTTFVGYAHTCFQYVLPYYEASVQPSNLSLEQNVQSNTNVQGEQDTLISAMTTDLDQRNEGQQCKHLQQDFVGQLGYPHLLCRHFNNHFVKQRVRRFEVGSIGFVVAYDQPESRACKQEPLNLR